MRRVKNETIHFPTHTVALLDIICFLTEADTHQKTSKAQVLRWITDGLWDVYQTPTETKDTTLSDKERDFLNSLLEDETSPSALQIAIKVAEGLKRAIAGGEDPLGLGLT